MLKMSLKYKSNMFNTLAVISAIIALLPLISCEKKEDIWQQDLSDSFKIDPSTQGLQKLNLKCGAESMHIELETEEDFTGVMYTRGSFYKQDGPCFVRPKRVGRKLSMSFGLDQCQTVKNNEDDVYSNVVIVQHEPDLVMPGDAAFAVECDYRTPRSMTLNADFQARDRTAIGSRITLTSPDPGAARNDKPQEWDTVHSEKGEVAFIPAELDPARKIRNTNGTDQKVIVHPQQNKAAPEIVVVEVREMEMDHI